MHVCILGASGLVGRAVVERLSRRRAVRIKPVVHSIGNAWSLLRHNRKLITADLKDSDAVEAAVQECTHVVNCTLGAWEDMPENVERLVNACVKRGVRKLVHVSSVTVYGERPHPGCRTESGPARPARGSYGWYKMQQDAAVYKAHKRGLSSVVLCAPHVTGPYARVILQLVDSLRKGTFALVDDGKYPCNLVDVNNLCHAIELALLCEKSDGRRIFITNGDNYTWKDLAYEATELAEVDPGSIPRITAREAERLGGALGLLSFGKRALKHPDILAMANLTVLRRNRHLYGSVAFLYRLFRLNRTPARRIASRGAPDNSGETLEPWLCQQQLRGVRHEITKARDILGYEPLLDSRVSFRLFKEWYGTMYGFGSEYWPLARDLMA